MLSNVCESRCKRGRADSKLCEIAHHIINRHFQPIYFHPRPTQLTRNAGPRRVSRRHARPHLPVPPPRARPSPSRTVAGTPACATMLTVAAAAGPERAAASFAPPRLPLLLRLRRSLAADDALLALRHSLSPDGSAPLCRYN